MSAAFTSRSREGAPSPACAERMAKSALPRAVATAQPELLHLAADLVQVLRGPILGFRWPSSVHGGRAPGRRKDSRMGLEVNGSLPAYCVHFQTVLQFLLEGPALRGPSRPSRRRRRNCAMVRGRVLTFRVSSEELERWQPLLRKARLRFMCWSGLFRSLLNDAALEESLQSATPALEKGKPNDTAAAAGRKSTQGKNRRIDKDKGSLDGETAKLDPARKATDRPNHRPRPGARKAIARPKQSPRGKKQ